MELQLSLQIEALPLALAALAGAVQAGGYVVLRTALTALRPAPPPLAIVAATVLAGALAAAAGGLWTGLAPADTLVGGGATLALVLLAALLALARHAPWRVILVDPTRAAGLGVAVAPRVLLFALVALGLALAGSAIGHGIPSGIESDVSAAGSPWTAVVAALALPASWAMIAAFLAAPLDMAAVILLGTPPGLVSLGALLVAVGAAAGLGAPSSTESGEPSPR